MSDKITVLPTKNTRCIECGRDLPKGRREKCFVCRPRRPHKTPPPEPETSDPEYTLADRVAQAKACELSYGQLMALIEAGKPLPFRHKVYWPEGSSHEGE